MPKHLLLFATFMALLVALFYHPVPDPETWDADARHIELPNYPKLDDSNTEVEKTQDVADWSEQLENSFYKHQKVEVLSSIQ